MGYEEEREFLHDVSNYLVVAQGMTGYVFGKLSEEKPEDSKEVVRLKKAVNAIDSLVTIVKARREKIKQEHDKA